MSKILITGSEGSLMQSVIPILIDNGHHVVGIDNLSRHGKRGNFRSEKYRLLTSDASNPYDMNYILTSESIKPEGGFDYIIQAAATIFGVGGFNSKCADIISNDLAIQINMLQLAVRHKIKKFIYISSSMVYETCPSIKNGNSENEPFENLAPKTDYGLSKFTGERMVQAFHKQHKLPYMIWRPFNIITPKEISDGSQGYCHVFADFIDSIIGDKVNTLNIIGDGNQIRCFTWIDDVANVIAKNSMIELPMDGLYEPIYNIGNPEPISMIDLAIKIKTIGYSLGLCDDKPLKFNTTKSFPNDVKFRIPNIEKLKSHFNFNITKNLDESLKECILHYSRTKIKW